MGIFKKSLAVLLAVLMLLSIAAVMASAEEVDYFVTGTDNLCAQNWVAADEADKMELGEDGLYTKTYTDVAVADGYQIKVTDSNKNWYGPDGNYTFNVVEVCDVTVTFNAETQEINVTGDGVVVPTELKIDYIAAVGDNANDPAFLNGISWDPAAEANRMSTEDGKVFTITYKGVAKGTYQVKFAANGAWTDNWGVKDDSAEGEAVYNGDNIYFDVDLAVADVTLTLDLTNFDYNAKAGATYSIVVAEPEAEATPDEPKETDPATPDEPATTDPEDTTPSETDPEDTTPEPEIVPGFYLVGSEEVCGAEWDTNVWTYNNTPMAYNEEGDYYYKVVTDVPKSEGNVTDEGNDVYVFKVIYVSENGAVTWHPDGMGNNTVVKVEEDGSSIAFTFVLLSTSPTKPNANEAVVATVYGPGVEVPEVPTLPTQPDVTEPDPGTTEPSDVTNPTTAPTQPTTKAPAATTKKSANTIKVKVTAKKSTVSFKASKLKKKKQTVSLKKVIKVTKAKGTVTYKVTGSKKVSIKKGKLILKKGKYKKGKVLKIKIKVTAKGNSKYKKKTVTTKTIKIKIKK